MKYCLAVNRNTAMQVHTHNLSLGRGADTKALYNLCVTLCYKNHAVFITETKHCLQLRVYTYKYNYILHDSITVSNLIVCFFISLNYFSKF
jgi:hypothetical protein